MSLFSQFQAQRLLLALSIMCFTCYAATEELISQAPTGYSKERWREICKEVITSPHTRKEHLSELLVRAITAKDGEIIELLLKYPQKYDIDGFVCIQERDINPLAAACLTNNNIAAEQLIRLGADTNAMSPKDGLSMLDSALFANNAELFALLLQHGAKINKLNQHGMTALTKMAGVGRMDAVERLLQWGACVNYGTFTSLMAAVGNGHEAVATLLIAQGADVNTTDEYGLSALYYAIQGEQLKLIEVLIAAGANIHHRMKGNLTALMFCTSAEVAQILVKHGASLNEPSALGNKVLLHAADNGSAAMLEYLLEQAESSVDDERTYATLLRMLMLPQNSSQEQLEKIIVVLKKAPRSVIHMAQEIERTRLLERIPIKVEVLRNAFDALGIERYKATEITQEQQYIYHHDPSLVQPRFEDPEIKKEFTEIIKSAAGRLCAYAWGYRLVSVGCLAALLRTENRGFQIAMVTAALAYVAFGHYIAKVEKGLKLLGSQQQLIPYDPSSERDTRPANSILADGIYFFGMSGCTQCCLLHEALSAIKQAEPELRIFEFAFRSLVSCSICHQSGEHVHILTSPTLRDELAEFICKTAGITISSLPLIVVVHGKTVSHIIPGYENCTHFLEGLCRNNVPHDS